MGEQGANTNSNILIIVGVSLQSSTYRRGRLSAGHESILINRREQRSNHICKLITGIPSSSSNCLSRASCSHHFLFQGVAEGRNIFIGNNLLTTSQHDFLDRPSSLSSMRSMGFSQNLPPLRSIRDRGAHNRLAGSIKKPSAGRCPRSEAVRSRRDTVIDSLSDQPSRALAISKASSLMRSGMPY